MELLHPIERQKVEELKKSLVENGWIGGPLVIWGDYMITGNHRFTACEELEMDFPTIELDEVFAEAGLDIKEIHGEYDYPTVTEPAFVDMVNETLPESVKEKYGIDIN